VVKPAADGSLLLKASAAAIYGTTLVYEKRYSNLGYWSSADDHAVWTLEVPKAGRYAVWLEWACPNGNSGTGYVMLVAGERAWRTWCHHGSWDIYKEAKAGELSLPADARG
jgi:hypothetical protein